MTSEFEGRINAWGAARETEDLDERWIDAWTAVCEYEENRAPYGPRFQEVVAPTLVATRTRRDARAVLATVVEETSPQVWSLRSDVDKWNDQSVIDFVAGLRTLRERVASVGWRETPAVREDDPEMVFVIPDDYDGHLDRPQGFGVVWVPLQPIPDGTLDGWLKVLRREGWLAPSKSGRKRAGERWAEPGPRLLGAPVSDAPVVPAPRLVAPARARRHVIP